MSKESSQNQRNTNPISNNSNVFSNKLKKSIRSIINKEGYIEYTIENRNITNDSGYLGVLQDISVTGRTTDGEKETNIFVKSILPTEESVKIVSISDVYETEIFAYKELFKMFHEIQEEAKVPIQVRYKTVKCYEESDAQDLIMENLVSKGFQSVSRLDVASLEYVELCMKQLAKFHGLSLVIKQKYPEFFDTKIKTIRSPYKFEKEWQPFVDGTKSTVMEHVDEQYKERVEKAYKNSSKKYPEYVTDENYMLLLCHGDFRPSNIMARIQNGKVQEVMPLDYQLMHYGSAMYDIFYLLTFSTDRAMRKKHLYYLRDVYYETLRNHLKYFNIDSETVYSRKVFEKQFDERRDWVLMIMLCVATFIFASETAVTSEGITFQMDSRYRSRLRDVIEEHIELGHL